MEFGRRKFLQASGALGALAFSRASLAAPDFDPDPRSGWRWHEIKTAIEVHKSAGATRVWVPLPQVAEPNWMRPLGNTWQGNASETDVVRDPIYGAEMLRAVWPASERRPVLEVVSRVAMRDRAIDFSRPVKVAPLDPITRALYTRATELLPTDGIVRQNAEEITRGARTDLERARRIYDWICDNTLRDPKVLGCGPGDIRGMLVTGNLAGKCADINSLYVGLARAVGLPARDVYGIRVADSRFGYKSLGKSGDISKAQHCRAEVWLADFGWVPVDPADVRKVVQEEKPGLRMSDDLVRAVRAKLFGAWEMNWAAYNFAHDLSLPGSAGPVVPFLMYPQGETEGGRLDSLRPDEFQYRILAREISGT